MIRFSHPKTSKSNCRRMRCLVLFLSLLECIRNATAFSSISTAFDIQKKSHWMSSTALSAEGSSNSITLYGHPGTRSPLVNWACHELGVDFEMGDLAQNPHPFKQLPCLTDSNGAILFESGAILQYLNFEYAKLTKAQLASVISWITWANASLDPICFLETPDGKVYDTGLKQRNKRIDVLESILGRQEYLVDDAGFSLADVAVSAYLL